jgi:enterochelin esterase-like enzyme
MTRLFLPLIHRLGDNVRLALSDGRGSGNRIRTQRQPSGSGSKTFFTIAALVLYLLVLTQPAVPQRLVSPRIDRLKLAITKEGRSELDRFWEELNKTGAPIVEPLDTDSGSDLVTFIWRGASGTKNVLIDWGTFQRPFDFRSPKEYLMFHLGNTDLWYRTFKFPNAARLLYRLSPNDRLKPNASGSSTSTPSQLDPLNPKRRIGWSLLELPGAPPQPYALRRPGLPEGQVERRPFVSQILGNEREVEIYIPPNADRSNYALLVVFDLEEYRKGAIVPLPTILDNLIAEKQIPPTVAVMVGNVKRFQELGCNAKFAAFLNQELVPWMRKEYRATTDSQLTTLAGSSFGGLAAACAAIQHPETFGNVLSQSGSFNWEPNPRDLAAQDRRPKTDEFHSLNWVAREIARRPRMAVRFYLNAGLFETMTDRQGNTQISDNRQLRDVLRSKGYELLHEEFAGGHSPVNWRGTFADGLIFLMHGRQ